MYDNDLYIDFNEVIAVVPREDNSILISFRGSSGITVHNKQLIDRILKGWREYCRLVRVTNYIEEK